MTHETVVPASLVAAHLDGSWAIVDCRFDLSRPEWGYDTYVAAHVPTAMYVHLNRDLSAVPSGHNGRHPLPTPERMADLFGRLGITRTTQVVVYDQDLGMYASRLWWMLRYMGHDAVALLDGGFARWIADRHPVSAGEETRAPAAFVPAPRPDLLATVDEVEWASQTGERLLVDARAPERFAGVSESLDRVAGHIPGAVNHFYKQNATPDGVMQPPEVLREAYERMLGGRPPHEVTMYCGSGVTACHNLLAMAHAGLPGATLYPGSWSEWSSDPNRDVETGEKAD